MKAASTATAGESNNSPPIGAVRSAAAARMARHRRRRQLGLKCVVILIRQNELDILVRQGWLARDDRDDAAAIGRALHQFLDQHLV